MEILIDNKKGSIWDMSEVVSNISWKTTRIGAAGILEFTYIKASIYQDPYFFMSNGNIVRVKYKGANVFYGYIFSIKDRKDEAVTVKCYDQIRYLMANDTYVFKNITASDVVKKIAGDFRLKTGRIDDTGYKIPTMVEDGKKLLDIICKALDLTLVSSSRNYVLFDDFGSLSVRNVEDMLVDFIIGDESLMYDFDYERSIDDEVYNKIKLYKDNKDSGKRELYVAQDSANIANWGVLQLYQSVDENKNAAQINEMLSQLIAIKNREAKKLKLEAIGDIRLRAGCYVPIVIEEFKINQPFLIDDCTHRFEGTNHTMSLELKVI